MAAREDQPQPIVRDIGFVVRLLRRDGRARRIRLEQLVETRPAAEPIDGLVSGRLDDPRPRKLGNPLRSPLAERSGKCLLCGVFREIKVTQDADERRDDAPPVGPVQLRHGFGGGRNHPTMVDIFRRRCRSGPAPFDSPLEGQMK